MKLDTTPLGPGQVLISLAGRMDIAGAAEIETAFSAHASHAHVTLVDMAGVTFLASIGIRLILANAKSLYKRGGKLVLTDARFVSNDHLRRVIERIVSKVGRRIG